VRDVLSRALEHAHVGAADLQQDIEVRAQSKERLGDQKLCQDDAQREDVALGIDRIANHLLGRHVAELSADVSGIGALYGGAATSDAEVGELDVALPVQEQVRRAHVAMNEMERLAVVVAQAVRIGERVRRFERDLQPRREGHRFVMARHRPKQTADGRSFHELHRHEERSAVLAEVEHGHDVRMLEPRGKAGFVDEHADELRIARVLRKDALERHALLEAVRAVPVRDEDLCHSACSQAALDPIGSERLMEHRRLRPPEHPAAGPVQSKPGRAVPKALSRISPELFLAILDARNLPKRGTGRVSSRC
jgi:hypothetical protein